MACALAGFAGALHPIADSLAIFQLPFALLGLVLLWRARRVVFWPAAVLTVLVATNVLWGKFAPTQPGPYTVYQKNLLFLLIDSQPIAADILAHSPDVITLQEVNTQNVGVLEALEGEYPNQGWCPSSSYRGTAVATRWPVLGDVLCSRTGGVTAIKAMSPSSGPVWLVSLHLHWPFPYQQSQQLEALLPLLENLDAPVILGGDFNMVPWANAVRAVARATGTTYSGARAPTFYIEDWVPVPIDHVLAGGGSGVVRPAFGSDHMGVFAHVSAPARR